MSQIPPLHSALALAGTGFFIFPCRPADKAPFIKWRDESTSDTSTIENWWARWPHALIGIDLGKSDLIVVDLDRHGGPDGVAEG